jgi:hypothetical protein
MWKERIGEDAGTLWRLLSEQGPLSLLRLKKLTLLDEQRVLLALGWLAREDKVDERSIRGRKSFALAE